MGNKRYLSGVQGSSALAMKHAILLFSLLLCGSVAFAQEPEQHFYSNGRLESTRFNDGALDRFITYYESGRVKEMGAFLNGRRHGVWKQFDENGTVMAEACFSKGHRVGTWEFRDGTNALRGRLSYSDGRLMQGEQYDAGALVAQRTY